MQINISEQRKIQVEVDTSASGNRKKVGKGGNIQRFTQESK